MNESMNVLTFEQQRAEHRRYGQKLVAWYIKTHGPRGIHRLLSRDKLNSRKKKLAKSTATAGP